MPISALPFAPQLKLHLDKMMAFENGAEWHPPPSAPHLFITLSSPPPARTPFSALSSPSVTYVSRHPRNAGILDLPLKPIFSRPHAVPAAGRRHPQPAFCSRPLSSPGYWSSSSLSSPCCCSRPPCWPPPCCRGWRSRASASRRRSCGASGAARPKFFAPAARRDGRRGPSRGTPHEAHGPTCGVVWGVFGGSTSGAEKNFMTFFFFPVNR